eukprot:13134096-Alexandrium_andersonii.AAC.1
MPLSTARNRQTSEPCFSKAGAGGAAVRTAPPAPRSASWGSSDFADSEPPRGPFGPLGELT